MNEKIYKEITSISLLGRENKKVNEITLEAIPKIKEESK